MLLNVALLAAAIYASLCLALFLFQASLVYIPSRALFTTPQAAGLKYEDVWITTEDDVRIHGWFVFHPKPRGTVLFFHGNAGNIGDRIESLSIFHRLGLNSFIIDYHGYGNSSGTVGEKETYLDARAAWNHLLLERKVPAQNIVLFGRSLGGGVAARLASQVTPAGLIIESGFTSVPDLASKYYPVFPVRQLARIRYDSKAALADVRCPVLIVHSIDDEIVPFSHATALYESASPPKSLLQLIGGHNDGFLRTGTRYVDGLGAFLGKVLPPPDG